MTDQRQEPTSGSSADYQGTSQAWKPVLIVGAVLLVLALLGSFPATVAQGDERRADSSETFSDLAIMGGVKRTNLSDDFKGGGATAVMGGVEIDLRDATMEREEAVLDVSAVMGGVKIRVPENWTVVSKVNTVMGGFKDRTRHPATGDHRVVLKGTVVMGGLEISN